MSLALDILAWMPLRAERPVPHGSSQFSSPAGVNEWISRDPATTSLGLTDITDVGCVHYWIGAVTTVRDAINGASSLLCILPFVRTKLSFSSKVALGKSEYAAWNVIAFMTQAWLLLATLSTERKKG